MNDHVYGNYAVVGIYGRIKIQVIELLKSKYLPIPAILLITWMPTLGGAQSSAWMSTFAEENANSLLSAFMAYTDLRIRSVQRNLEILSTTSEVRSDNWSDMKDLLKEYQNSDQGFIVWYTRPDGTYYTADRGRMDKSLKTRAYFPDLIAGIKITGAIVISKATRERSAIIAVPINLDGKVIGAVGASLFLDTLSEQVNKVLELRPDIDFFALAPNGLTTLHRKKNRHFLDPRELGSKTLKKAATEMLTNTSGKTTYMFDNVSKKAVYRTSELTGWKFAIAFSTIPAGTD